MNAIFLDGRPLEGIVVRIYASGESDAVLRVITRDRGKLSLFAPRMRKSRRRFGSSVDILDWGAFEMVKGKGALPIIQSFAPRSSFPHIRSNFEKLALATFICEAFDMALPEDSVEKEDVFESLRLCLSALDEAGDLRTALRSCYYALSGLLQWSGVLQEVEQPSANALLRIASRLEEYAQRQLLTKDQLRMVLESLRRETQE